MDAATSHKHPPRGWRGDGAIVTLRDSPQSAAFVRELRVAGIPVVNVTGQGVEKGLPTVSSHTCLSPEIQANALLEVASVLPRAWSPASQPRANVGLGSVPSGRRFTTLDGRNGAGSASQGALALPPFLHPSLVREGCTRTASSHRVWGLQRGQ